MTKRTKHEIELKIIELYNSGLSMSKSGEPFNVSAATVMHILDRNNIPKRTKGGIYKLPEEEIIKRYQQGESCQTIANSFKVTFNTISNILKKMIYLEIINIKILVLMKIILKKQIDQIKLIFQVLC